MVATRGKKHAIQQKRKQEEDIPRDVKKLRREVLHNLAVEVHSMQKGLDRYGKVREYIKTSQGLYPWITRDKIYYEVSKIKKAQKEACVATPYIAIIPPVESATRTKGRPSGTTNKAKAEDVKNKKKAINYTAVAYNKELIHARDEGRKPRALSSITEEALSEHGLEGTGFFIPRSTIHSRIARKNLEVDYLGCPSPMKEAEKVLLGLILQLAQMGKPISVSQGLLLANSLIKGTPMKQKIEKFQKDRKMFGDKDGSSTGMTLGKTYWKLFMRRHGQELQASRAVKFASSRQEWATYQNFEAMYELCYMGMVKAGVAEELPDGAEVLMDEHGSIVESEKEAFGLPVKHRVIRPDHILFVDEVGSNTNQKNDGNNGGEKCLVARGTKAKQKAATGDTHFTVLGFTASTGEPVMCAILIQGYELTAEQTL